MTVAEFHSRLDAVRAGLADNDPLLKVSEVARRLSVEPKQVRKWIKCGALRARRLPLGQYRIAESELARLLK